jgi:hypothetical protein
VPSIYILFCSPTTSLIQERKGMPLLQWFPFPRVKHRFCNQIFTQQKGSPEQMTARSHPSDASHLIGGVRQTLGGPVGCVRCWVSGSLVATPGPCGPVAQRVEQVPFNTYGRRNRAISGHKSTQKNTSFSQTAFHESQNCFCKMMH